LKPPVAFSAVAFSALTLFVGRQERHLTCKKWGMVEVGTDLSGWSGAQPDDVSASVYLPLHHKVQKFCSGTGSPRWSQEKGRKTVVAVCGEYCNHQSSWIHKQVKT